MVKVLFFFDTFTRVWKRGCGEKKNRNVHHGIHHAKEKRSTIKIEVWHLFFSAYYASTVVATHIDSMLDLYEWTIIVNRCMIRLIQH